MPERFAVLEISLDVLLGVPTIVVLTNRECHLFCRYTEHDWRKHPLASARRGTWLPVDVRFCFVEYADNEQEEAGDTLEHTFLKPEFVFCHVYFFYFWGTIAGIPTPSTTAIYKWHPIYVEPGYLFFEKWTWHWIDPPDFPNAFMEYWSS